MQQKGRSLQEIAHGVQPQRGSSRPAGAAGVPADKAGQRGDLTHQQLPSFAAEPWALRDCPRRGAGGAPPRPGPARQRGAGQGRAGRAEPPRGGLRAPGVTAGGKALRARRKETLETFRTMRG